MTTKFFGLHTDFIGFGASVICALHCIATPIILSLAPLSGLQFIQDERIEYAFILISFIIASYALLHGYYRHHKRSKALLIAISGFLVISAGHFLHQESVEIILTSIGAFTIAGAHFVNWKLIKESRIGFPDCLHPKKDNHPSCSEQKNSL